MSEEVVTIESVLSPELINLHLNGRTKDEVLKEMVQMLFDAGKVTDFDEFLADVYLREEEGVTGIGEGIAIPHGKSDSVQYTSVVVGRSDEPVEWPSIDGNPVNLIIMLAVKSFDKTVHIRLLSKVATSLCNKNNIKRLMEAESAEEVISAFAAA